METNQIESKPRCPRCNSRRTVKAGFNVTTKGKIQLYQCNMCAYTFSKKPEEYIKNE